MSSILLALLALLMGLVAPSAISEAVDQDQSGVLSVSARDAIPVDPFRILSLVNYQVGDGSGCGNSLGAGVRITYYFRVDERHCSGGYLIGRLWIEQRKQDPKLPGHFSAGIFAFPNEEFCGVASIGSVVERTYLLDGHHLRPGNYHLYVGHLGPDYDLRRLNGIASSDLTYVGDLDLRP